MIGVVLNLHLPVFWVLSRQAGCGPIKPLPLFPFLFHANSSSVQMYIEMPIFRPDIPMIAGVTQTGYPVRPERVPGS